MKNIRIITYYGYYNSKGEVDSFGDHWGIDVVDANTNTTIISYGDEYHDKGESKLEGFLDGLNFAGVQYTLTYENKAHMFAELFDEGE